MIFGTIQSDDCPHNPAELVTSTVIAFAAADSRDSSRSEHSLGVENRFHVDVEGFQIAGHLSQAAYRLDDTV